LEGLTFGAAVDASVQPPPIKFSWIPMLQLSAATNDLTQCIGILTQTVLAL
jgi:hypothetical protein